MTPYEQAKAERFPSYREVSRELTRRVPPPPVTVDEANRVRDVNAHLAAEWLEYEQRRRDANRKRRERERLQRQADRETQERLVAAVVRQQIDEARRRIRAERRSA